MAENKALNEEALVEMAHTMGFDLAHACAAAADAFARGVADGFAAYAQELAEKHRDGTQPDGLRPLPCIGCVNGLRFKPKEEEPCEEYTEAAGFNNG